MDKKKPPLGVHVSVYTMLLQLTLPVLSGELIPFTLCSVSCLSFSIE